MGSGGPRGGVVLISNMGWATEPPLPDAALELLRVPYVASGRADAVETWREAFAASAFEPTAAPRRRAACCADSPPPNMTLCPQSPSRRPSALPRLPAPMMPSFIDASLAHACMVNNTNPVSAYTRSV